MASNFFISGPYQSLYIGLASGASPMQLVTLDTTGPYQFSETIPRSWVQATGQYEQEGARVITLNLAFLSLDDLAIKVSRGLALDASTVYGTPTQTQYSVLLVDGEDLSTNLYIPCCESLGPFQFNRDKTQQTQVALNLSYTSPDLNSFMWAMGTLAELEAQCPPALWPL